MLKKVLSKGFLCASVLGMMSFIGCSSLVDDGSDAANDDSQYGYIKVSTDDSDSARYVDSSTINKAKVTVTGYNMTSIGPVEASISGSSGSVTIEKIPVGKRVFAAQAYKDSDIVTGKIVYAVKNIVAGDNGTISITKDTSAEGKAYYYLAANSVDISKITSITGISSVTDYNLFDADAFAKAYASNSSVSAASYVLKASNVTFTASNASGYTVWVSDPSSTKASVTSDGTYTISGVAPGTWSVYVNDGTTTTVKGTVTVSGDGSAVASGITVGNPLSGKTIVFVKTSTATNIYVWYDGTTTELNGSWPGKVFTSSDCSAYMNDATGWKMVDISDNYDASKGSIDFLPTANNSSTVSGDVKSGKTATFWWDGTTFYDSDPTTAVVPAISAKYSSGTVTLTSSVDVTSASVTVSSGSNSTTVTSFTNKTATVDVSSWGLAEGATITVSGTINGTSVSANCTVTSFSGVKIYVSASSAPTIWVWQPSGLACTQAMGYSWTGQPTMPAATDLIYNKGWYVLEIGSDYYTEGKTFSINVNSSGDVATTRTATFWYDLAGVSGTAGAYYDADPTKKPEPVAPTLTISPASGKEIGTSSSIKVTADFGNDTPTVATVTINGTAKTLSEGTNSFAVKDFATEAGKTITVSGTLTNSKGTATVSATYTTKVLAEDPFCWENVNAYFVLTDRFYNGDSTNDYSYNRQNGSKNSTIGTGDENVATFHGGDLKGLTAKLDYFDKLGVNAIWFTAPYEQIHGWVAGKNNAFPHYAFHGYYTLDWTSMDKNMGTLEELRTFVNACHSKGIRVIMDVVMNHVGYNNTEDMVEFSYGYTEHTSGWLAKTDGAWVSNDTVKWDNSYWDSTWWGPWIRSFGYTSGNYYGGDCGGLPDVKTELGLNGESSVGMAPVMTKKWNQDSSDYKKSYYNPSVAAADWNGYSGDYRQDRGLLPADYQVIWLSAWVREVGIDGFRCDTAKHVEPARWGQLKVACQAALEAWRNDSTKSKLYNGVDTGAAEWDESFWMTGECFGWTALNGEGGDYYGTGKFDSMIGFALGGGDKWDGGSYFTPTITSSTWGSYLGENSNKHDDDGNGNYNNVLTYISSHDTRLSRWSDQKALGTMFELLPRGIQVYYGDETNRSKAYTGCGDGDMMTRGDFDWSASTGDCATHWAKVGTFRKYNPAVGAGTGSATLRTYSGAAGDNKVAINISSTTTDVSSLWSDGTTVYNWYDGKSATVSGGSVTFSGGSQDQPILISDKNPATYGVTF